jgi:tRNA pseudouridine55 synthase
MARKRKGRPIHGWIVLDKPLEMSSMQAVSKVRRYIDAAKAGHGGTLDPLATGVLPIAFGDATKTISYVMDASKEYRFEIVFGEARNTDDAEGEVVETSDNRPTKDEIINILPEFTGDIEQIPPKYSAIKVDGKRSYALARAGKEDEFELSSRTVTIQRIKLEECEFDSDGKRINKASFIVQCSKGTYVRSLARDVSKKLGTCGYVSMLRRTKCGTFSEKNTILLENIKDLGHSATASEYFYPIEAVLDDILALLISEENARNLLHGRAVLLEEIPVKQSQEQENPETGQIVRAMHENRLIALCRIDDDIIVPIKVMSGAQELYSISS